MTCAFNFVSFFKHVVSSWHLIYSGGAHWGLGVDMTRGWKWAEGPKQGGQWRFRGESDDGADSSAAVERVGTTQTTRTSTNQKIKL